MDFEVFESSSHLWYKWCHWCIFNDDAINNDWGMEHWEADRIIDYNWIRNFLYCTSNRFLGKDLIAKGILFWILTPLYIILLCNRLVEYLKMWRVRLHEELTAVMIRVNIWQDFIKRGESSGERREWGWQWTIFAVSCVPKYNTLSTFNCE